jgi:hypothetical protein
MAFVINEKTFGPKSTISKNVFDLTPFNYMINKSNAFIDGNFLRTDHEFMNNLLKNMLQININHLN